MVTCMSRVKTGAQPKRCRMETYMVVLVVAARTMSRSTFPKSMRVLATMPGKLPLYVDWNLGECGRLPSEWNGLSVSHETWLEEDLERFRWEFGQDWNLLFAISNALVGFQCMRH